MQENDIIPSGTVTFEEFPEKILLLRKHYPIKIKLRNNSDNKDNSVDYYLKYRVNGFKIVEIPDNLKSEVWFSMSPKLEYNFSLEIEPTIEGPLQFEINMFGKKITYSQIEKVRKIEVEVEKEIQIEESDVPVVLLDDIKCEFCKNYKNEQCELTSLPANSTDKCGEFQIIEGMRLESEFPIKQKTIEICDEKYFEEDVNTEEILTDSKAIYMEAIDTRNSTNLENFMTMGDVSSNIEQIKVSTIIFYFPMVTKSENDDFLREINKKMQEMYENSFFYLNFPISQSLSDSELNSIQEGINKFLPRIQHLDSKLILNLDFIPKIDKPTIILGNDDKGKAQEIHDFLINRLGTQNFDIILDSNIFSGGNFLEQLNSFCNNVEADIINLVLSDNFKENHSLFIEFLKVFSE